ncbi:hypothetical protein C2S52_016551 [Perilla frutescens var. hirtella]|nr:hypothetical protein C2S52_016551 [Perilla frutescens var. hirtella]
MSSCPATTSHHTSPIHLLRHYRLEMDNVHTSLRRSNYDTDNWETDSPSPSRFHGGGGGDASSHHIELSHVDREVVLRHEPSSSQVALLPHEQHGRGNVICSFVAAVGKHGHLTGEEKSRRRWESHGYGCRSSKGVGN